MGEPARCGLHPKPAAGAYGLAPAYADNENDEYHAPVSIVDVWANYAALAGQGWTQQKIAEAVGVSRVMVSYRLSLNNMPNEIKNYVTQDMLSETHLREIIDLSLELHLSPWLTTEAAQYELCQQAIAALAKTWRNQKAVGDLRGVMCGPALPALELWRHHRGRPAGQVARYRPGATRYQAQRLKRLQPYGKS